MVGLYVFLAVVGVFVLLCLVAFLSSRSDRNHEVRTGELKKLRAHVARAEAALDDVEVALESYVGLDIVGAALAQDVRSIVRNHRQDTRKIEEKRNK